MPLTVPDHPLVRRALVFGDGPAPREKCACGAPAEVWSSARSFLCRRCALDTWYLLKDETRLEMLGYERLS